MSTYDPAIHRRQSIRMRGHDYAGCGAYFVTICIARTGHSRPLFGTVVNGRMALNEAGRIAADCWRAIPTHFPHATLDEWCIMPDHVHGILHIDGAGTACGEGLACQAPPAFGRPIPGALGTIIGAFKSATTRNIRAIPRTGLACQTPTVCQTPTACRAPAACQTPIACQTPTWQRNYYDIIIRDERALNNIRRYIRDNPAHWDTLRYGEPCFFLGNRALLDLPMTAFLASRGRDVACHAPAGWPVRPQCVVSGFLSPMERAVFDACLTVGIPMVWVSARGFGFGMPSPVQRAIDAGKLLIMTPFAADVTRFSSARAAWCNQYALHLASNIVIGQLSQDGMLACLLADLRENKPVNVLF